MTIPATLLLLGVHTEHTGFVAAGNTPIVITSDSTPDVNTGDTAVVTVTTTGGTGDIDFSIIGGADAGLFTINDETGALAFTAPSVDGTYVVIVRAFSDWGSAQQTITVTVAASSYTGPLDLVPGAVLAYSPARALSAAWIGQNVIKLRRDSDDAMLDFVAGVDGSVDVAAVTAWLAGANALVEILYDQSGNGLDLEPKVDAEIAWTASEVNGHPAAGPGSGLGTLWLQSSDTGTFVGGAMTGFVVAKTTGISHVGIGGVGGAEGNAEVRFEYFATNDVDGPYTEITDDVDPIEADYVSAVPASAAYKIQDGTLATGTANLKINGATVTPFSTSLTGEPGDITDFSSIIKIGDGFFAEGLLYAAVLNDANRLAIRQNMATYFGITL